MNDMPDFAKVVDQSLRAQPPRGDEKFAHISDLYGCDLATWARRRGLPELPFEPRTLVKFEMGHAVEETVAKAIRENYPGDSTRNRRIAWYPQAPANESVVVLDEDVEPEDGGIVGHMDIDLDDRRIVEVKSTAFFRGKEPTEPDVHYIEQAAGYAAAWNAEKFGICIVDRVSGKILTWWYNTDEYCDALNDTPRKWARERALEMLEKTDPAVPFAPAPAPRTSFACRTCRYAACSENKNLARFQAGDVAEQLRQSLEGDGHA